MGRQSLGFVLCRVVFGIGVILLKPQHFGKIPCWRQELYRYMSSKDRLSKASLRSRVRRLSMAEDLEMLISFNKFFTCRSVIQQKLKEEDTLMLHFSFFQLMYEL